MYALEAIGLTFMISTFLIGCAVVCARVGK